MSMQKSRAHVMTKNMYRVVGFRSHDFFDFMSIRENTKKDFSIVI